MGKTAKNKKRRLAAEIQLTSTPISSNNSEDGIEVDVEENKFLNGLISISELNITVKTLTTLTKQTELLKYKNELKSLRGAVFDFQRINNELTGTGNTLTSRITAALDSSRSIDALVLLSELRIRKIIPKLGALQRWVRSVDAASSLDGSFGKEEALEILNAILRTTLISTDLEGNTIETDETDGIEGGEENKSIVKRMKEWKLRELSGENIYEQVQLGLIPISEEKVNLATSFKLLQTTPGSERLPPNLHPALLYSSLPSTIPLNLSLPKSISHSVPHVPGAFLLADVLSSEECKQIIISAESVGFNPDKPVGEGGISILAHNLYWLADNEFLKVIWERIKDSMPVDPVFGEATGLNARFRVYRYVPGSIYRPHYDGRWPASGIDPVTGEYMYDSSPTDAPQWSRFTFLLYLNDSFTSGHTTFFLPSSQTSSLNAYPVKPITGCALVFPHGDASGSLLHEGSPLGSGGKYVIRTDVLYKAFVKCENGGRMKGEGEGVMDVDI